MYKNILILIFFVIFLTSCSETVFIDQNEEDRLLIECELNPGKPIRARLTTLSNFYNTDDYTFPKNAEINLYTGEDIKLTFEYNDRENYYYIPQGFHTINPDYKYRIEAKLPMEADDMILTSETNIPQPSLLTTFNKTSALNIKEGSDEGKTQVTLNLQIPSSSAQYFRLNVYRKVFEEKWIGGQMVKVWNGKTEAMNFDSAINTPLSFHESLTEPFVLINAKNLDDNRFTLIYHSESIIGSSDKLDHVYYEFETLTEASYKYNVSKIKQLKAEIYGNTEPVINYTNAINGYGFLGASSGVRDSLEIN